MNDGYRLSARVRNVVASLVPVVCPEGALRLGLVEPLVQHAELSLGSFPPLVSRALSVGLTTYDLSAVAWPPGRGRTASNLAPHKAAAWFAFWWRSPLLPQRELAKAVKSILCLGYYEMPAVQAEMGYTPQAWIDTVKRRRLAVHAEAIRSHEAQLIERDPLPSSLAARRAATREAGSS